jgi:hypothetical protein
MSYEFPPEGTVSEPEFLSGLVQMARDRFTGALRFERDDVVKIVYVRDGGIVSASTNEPSEGVDEILLRGGKATRDHIHQAVAKRIAQESIGEALLRVGFISRKELLWARRQQVVSVLRSVLQNQHWHYTIVPDYVSSRDAEGPGFAAEQILLELVVTEESRERVDRVLEGGRARLRKATSFSERYERLDLNQDADRVIALVDGGRTAMDVAEEAGGDRIMNLRLLAALRILGLLRPSKESQGILEVSKAEESASLRQMLLPGVADDLPESSKHAPEETLIDGEPPEESLTDREQNDAGNRASAPDEGGEDHWGETAGEPERLEPPRAIEPEDPVASDPELRDEVYGDQWAEEEISFAGGADQNQGSSELVAEGDRRPRWLLPLIALGILLVLLVAGWWIVVRAETSREPIAMPEEIGRGERDVSEAERRVVLDDPGPTAGDPHEAAEPADPPPPNVDPLRARYDRMAEEYAGEAGSVPYTVQFVLVCETSSVTQARELGGENVWFVPVEFRGRSCFRVFWGRFHSETEARAAIPEIPERLRESRPVVIQPGEVS